MNREQQFPIYSVEFLVPGALVCLPRGIACWSEPNIGTIPTYHYRQDAQEEVAIVISNIMRTNAGSFVLVCFDDRVTWIGIYVAMEVK